MTIRKFTSNYMWPDQVYVKLKYRTYFATTSVNHLTIRGNGPFDPEYTVGGGQPEGWDQWIDQYNHYQCTASKIRYVINNPGTGSLMRLTIVPVTEANTADLIANTGGVTYTVQRPETYPYSRTKYIGNPGGSKTVNWLKHYMTTQKMIRRSKKSSDLQSSVSGNPPELWNWVLRTDTYNNAATLTTLHIDVCVTYYILFYDRTYPVDA